MIKPRVENCNSPRLPEYIVRVPYPLHKKIYNFIEASEKEDLTYTQVNVGNAINIFSLVMLIIVHNAICLCSRIMSKPNKH